MFEYILYLLLELISPAIISVYDKTGLLDLAKGLIKHNVRLLASGGTAKMIRESGFAVEYVLALLSSCLLVLF